MDCSPRSDPSSDLIQNEENIFANKQIACVFEQIDTLDQKQSSAIRHFYINRLSHAEIARLNNISVGASKKRLSRGMAILKTLAKKPEIN